MFSVVIPYYKKRAYIERCLDAVLSQTFQDFEIILVDDGSQDDIKELIERKYSEKVTLIQQKNQGVSAARNTGVANASQEYVAFLDADDYWQEHFLESIAEVVNKTNADLLATGFTNIIEKIQVGKRSLRYYKMSEDEYLLKSPYLGIINSSSIVINKGLFNKTTGFDTKLKRGEDIDMWLRLVGNAVKFVKIENILSLYDLNVANQVTNSASDFQHSFASRLEELSKQNKKYYLFAKRFMYYRLFEYSLYNPDKTTFFINLLKLKKPIFSFYRINPKFYDYFKRPLFRVFVNKYLKITIRLIK